MKADKRKVLSNAKIARSSHGEIWGYQRLVPLGLVLVTLAVFYPVLQNGFINWDDPETILKNPHYRGLGWRNLRWMFSTFHMGHYQPLSWLTFSVDYSIWGVDPVGYHLTNLLLHCAGVVVFYFIAVRLFQLSDLGSNVSENHAVAVAAGFAALLFAVHPLRVESVGWVTERRDVLSGLFILLTSLFYLHAVKIGEGAASCRRCMAATLALYSLSLLSKASGMTLPVVLLILDVYPLKRLGHGATGWFGPQARMVWREKLLFLAPALGAAIVALLAQYHAGAVKPLDQYGAVPRLAQSFYGLAFYLWKTVLPFNLSPLYEIPRSADAWRATFLLSGLAVLGITVALFQLRRSWPAVLAAWIGYVIVSLPTLGIAQSGPQLVADRYSYLACLGWALLAGAAIIRLRKLSLNSRDSVWRFVPVNGVAVLIIFGLGSLTWKQAQLWKDSETLWRHALSIQQESLYARNNLGNALAGQNRFEEAMDEFKAALRIDPHDADAHYNVANVLSRQGRFSEAVQSFHETLRIAPGYADAHYELGTALARLGELEQAAAHLRKALLLAPQDSRPHYNLGQILSMQGNVAEAIAYYRQALRIDPLHLKAHYYLAVALAEHGDLEGARREFQETARIEPTLAEAHAGLARVLKAQGKENEALTHHQQAVRLRQFQDQIRSAK
jgi:tetratricopeptide (TPR) repeat protein